MTTLGTVATLVCSKCAGEDILTRYHKQGCSDPKCGCAECLYGSLSKQHEEHLHYVCRTCQFDWIGEVANV